MLRISKAPLAVGFATLVALVAGRVAWGSIPDAAGVIHGCSAKTSSSMEPPGTVRVIDTGLGQSCQSTRAP